MIESLLIQFGIDKNKKDELGRVPLHYAFCDMPQKGSEKRK